jgi:hypothetical protein
MGQQYASQPHDRRPSSSSIPQQQQQQQRVQEAAHASRAFGQQLSQEISLRAPTGSGTAAAAAAAVAAVDAAVDAADIVAELSMPRGSDIDTQPHSRPGSFSLQHQHLVLMQQGAQQQQQCSSQGHLDMLQEMQQCGASPRSGRSFSMQQLVLQQDLQQQHGSSQAQSPPQRHTSPTHSDWEFSRQAQQDAVAAQLNRSMWASEDGRRRHVNMQEDLPLPQQDMAQQDEYVEQHVQQLLMQGYLHPGQQRELYAAQLEQQLQEDRQLFQLEHDLRALQQRQQQWQQQQVPPTGANHYDSMLELLALQPDVPGLVVQLAAAEGGPAFTAQSNPAGWQTVLSAAGSMQLYAADEARTPPAAAPALTQQAAVASYGVGGATAAGTHEWGLCIWGR